MAKNNNMKRSLLLIPLFFICLNLNTLTESEEKQNIPLNKAFSTKAASWADSIYYKLTFEERVARLFIIRKNNKISAENIKQKSVIQDITNGFDSGIKDLPFPNDRTIQFLSKEQWIETYPLLFNYMSEKGVSMLLASDEFPFHNKNRLTNNLNSYQSLWLPTGKIENSVPEAFKLNIIDEISNMHFFTAGNIFLTDDYTTDFQKLIFAFNNGKLSEATLEKSCKYILAFSYEASQKITIPTLKTSQKQKETILKKIYESSVLIFQNNNDNPFPIKTLDINIGYLSDQKDCLNMFKRFAENYLTMDTSTLNPNDYHLIFWLIGKGEFDYDTYQVYQQYLLEIKQLYTNAKIVLVTAGDLPFLDIPEHLDALIYHPSNVPYSWKAMAEAAFGGIEIHRRPQNFILTTPLVKKSRVFPKTRLKQGMPEEVGMNAKLLSEIDEMVEEAIENEATPGARVLVAKNGVVVFDKCYGWHTYDQEIAVEKNDIYDLASVTKIMATMPVIMQLYDKKRWKLSDEIAKLLPKADSTNISNITMKQLLLHESGLPTFIPFYADAVDKKQLKGTLFSPKETENHTIKLDNNLYMNNTAIYRDDIFQSKQDSVFYLPIAKDLFMNFKNYEVMKKKLFNSKVKAGNSYLYGDLNFLLLQLIAEHLYQEPLDQILNTQFSSRLGATTLCFNPWKHFPINQIAPTENDIYFRYQQIQGYVHDQMAAMMGGVAGHAGLFANANDLAKIMQMLLNKGEYGGYRYLSAETVDYFTSTRSEITKRGLGFDKYDPDKKAYSKNCSLSSYGHTGFTGTLVWIDPEHQLIYIFLSNRVHPDPNNSKISELRLRSVILNTVYRSFLE